MCESIRFVRAISMAVLAVWIAPAISFGQVADGYMFTTLPALVQYPMSISGNAVVGFNSTSQITHGVSYNGVSTTILDDPLAATTTAGTGRLVVGTRANGVSGSTIVGTYQDPQGLDHGFVYSGGQYTNLDDPLGVEGSGANAVSGSTIVGQYLDSSGDFHGYLYNADGFQTLDVPFAGALGTFPHAVSGTTVVGSYTSLIAGAFAASGFGFVDDNGEFISLSDPQAQPIGLSGNLSTTAVGISGPLIVGSYLTADALSHGYIYDGTVYSTVDDPLGVNGTTVTGIDGTTIVGYYLAADGVHGFEATSVPEPAVTGLMIAGAVLLLGRSRRHA